MKEYGIDNHPLSSKYRHAAVTWYRRRHLAQMDGVPFDMEMNPKPPKDFDERLAQTKAQIFKRAGNAGEDFKVVGSMVTENASHAGRFISENAKGLTESAAAKAFTEKASIAGAVVSEKAKIAGSLVSGTASDLKNKI